jgi:hypothetical protein
MRHCAVEENGKKCVAPKTGIVGKIQRDVNSNRAYKKRICCQGELAIKETADTGSSVIRQKYQADRNARRLYS